MIRASTRGPRTFLVAMVICLHACGATMPDSLTHGGVRYHKKHLKHGRGHMEPAGGAPNEHRDDDGDLSLSVPPESEVVLNPAEIRYFQPTFKSVRVDDFKLKAGRAVSYHDVLRMFLGDELSDEAIDKYVTNLSRQSGYLSRETARLTEISLQGTQSTTPVTIERDNTALAVRYYTSNVKSHKKHVAHDVRVGPSDKVPHDVIDIQYDDVMQADAPVCEMCHVIASSSVFKLSDSRRPAYNAETIRRRKRRHRPSMQQRKRESTSRKRNNKCKTRRKQLSDAIRQCRRRGNKQRCRKLRDRYQRLRQKCKRPEANEAGVAPSETAVLPDVRRPTAAPSSDNTSLALTEEPGIRPSDWERWAETKNDTQQHGQCGRPVKQTVRIMDLTHRGGEEYVPDCVVVYRCQDSGCCPAGQECGASSSVDVSKSILLGQLGRGGMVESFNVQHFLIPNHTSCECRDLPAIKQRPCPYPFNHSLHECTCVKESLHNYCSQIARGRTSLPTSSKRCVLEGDCRPLDPSVCEHFNREEGRCLRRRNTQQTTDRATRRIGAP